MLIQERFRRIQSPLLEPKLRFHEGTSVNCYVWRGTRTSGYPPRRICGNTVERGRGGIQVKTTQKKWSDRPGEKLMTLQKGYRRED